MLFFANKRGDKLELEAPTKYKNYIEALPKCRVVITLKRYRKPRSIEQNNLFHAIVQMIADYTGHTVAEVKGGFKVDMGLYAQRDGITLLISTASLNTEEMAKLTEHAYKVAAELNITVPTPEEWKAMQP